MTQVLGPEGAQLRRHLRVPGAADDHLHRRAVRHPLLLRRHAARRAAVRGRDAPGDAGVSGAESLNVAASIFMGQTEAPLTIRPYLPRMTESELMTVMTVRHGAHLRRHHGGLHPVRHRGAAPADGGDHDRAGHADDGQDLRARRPRCPRRWARCRLEIERTDVNVIDAAGRGTGEGLHAGAERRRDADLVPRADRAGQRAARPRRPQPAADLRLGVRAGRLEHGRAVARRAGDRQPARHAHGAQRVRRLLAARAAEGDRSIRGRSRSRRSRCAASPTSARSASRSAASARWRRRGGTISPGSACARCSPARSPTSSPRPSRGSCCERTGRPLRRGRRRGRAPAPARRRRLPDVGDRARLRASATSPTRSRDAVVDSVRRDPALAGVGGHRPRRASWSSGRSAGRRVAALCGPRALLRRARLQDGDLRDARARRASACGR